MVLAPPNSGFLRDPVSAGGGYDYFTEPGAPDDVLRFWRAGEHFPRLVIDLSSAPAKILVGNGLAYPTSNIIIGPSGLDAVDIAFTPNGSIAAIDVQHAIQEVRDEAGTGSGAGLPPGGSTDSALLKNSPVDGDADWRILTAGLIGAATAGALSSEQGARTNADVALGIRIDNIVTGGGTGDMLYSANLLGLTDLPAARGNLGLGNSATRDVGFASGDVAAGDAPQNAVDAIPKVDFDGVAVPDDTSLKADFFTSGAVTSLRGGKLATLDDIGSGSLGYIAVANDTAYSILATDRSIVQTGTMTVSKTIPLALAASVPAGTRVRLADRSGSPTEFIVLTFQRAGADTIANEMEPRNTTTLTVRAPYGKYELESDGISQWLVVGHGAKRAAAYWQHPRDIAIPDDVYCPIPWNAAITDDQGLSPRFDLFATTIAAPSDGATLPTGTINVASTAGFPSSGYAVITGPPKVIVAATSTVATDLITKVAHGFTTGMRVKVAGLTTTTGISNLAAYYVRDVTANTFKLSLTFGGAAIDLTGADDTGLIFWIATTDTVFGYTGKTATSFTGCNTAATNVPHTGISTGTLKTGMVVTGANCRFDLGAMQFIWNGVASIEYDANVTGRRGLRWRSATSPFYFPGVTEGPVAATGSIQNIIAAMQPAAFSADPGNSFIEAYQSSGGVLNVLTDGIQSPLLMLCYGSGR